MEENGDLVSLVPSKNRDRERLFGNVYVSRKCGFLLLVLVKKNY